MNAKYNEWSFLATDPLKFAENFNRLNINEHTMTSKGSYQTNPHERQGLNFHLIPGQLEVA